MTDHDDLVARYSTPEADLPADVRARQAAVTRMVEAGDLAPGTEPDDDFLIGLDDTLRPFPLGG